MTFIYNMLNYFVIAVSFITLFGVCLIMNQLIILAILNYTNSKNLEKKLTVDSYKVEL